jgi:uncharacterized protein
MAVFSRLIAEKWKLPDDLASTICASYDQGDWPYYLCEYIPSVSAELDIVQLWEIYDFLGDAAELAPKKKRLTNALRKAGKLTDALEHRIEHSVDSVELDDMLIVVRPNPRSRAQQALALGLGPLADLAEKQDVTEGSMEERAQEYVGRAASLKTPEDVLGGVKDILAERFAYDETARAMAREFCFEDGYFTVVPRNRKDPAFDAWRDREIPILGAPAEDLLRLLAAEDAKQMRLRLGVPLFRITEVLRHHFVQNADSIGFDLICQAIDDSWQRLLQDIVERDIKDRLRRDAETQALKTIVQDVEKSQKDRAAIGGVLAVGMDDAGALICVAVSGEGRILAATREQLTAAATVSGRLSGFMSRYRPTHVVVRQRADDTRLADIVRRTVGENGVEVALQPERSIDETMAQSDWVKGKCADLDAVMQRVFASGVAFLRPLGLVAEIGSQFFELHPMQSCVRPQRLSAAIGRMATAASLRRGIPVREVVGSVLEQVRGMPAGLLAGVRSRDVAAPLNSKADLLSVKGMTETIYRNIAGYIVLPSSPTALDATLVHPYFYGKLDEIAADIGTSVEGLVVNPGLLTTYASGDFGWQLFVRRNVIQQLMAGHRHMQSRTAPRRKLRLDELQEGMVVQGRVTNTSPFGVFVNINAVCDGLVHISQLADSFVESPDQVVSVGETVHVRVVKVDTGKRRISLSMKGLGNQTPRVKPSANHISTLIDHFSNR